MSHKFIYLSKSLETLLYIKEAHNYVMKAREIVNNYNNYEEYAIRFRYLASKLKSLLEDLDQEYNLINIPDDEEDNTER